jgi:type II restriction enzyme
MIDNLIIESIIRKYKGDPEGVYNTWFINNDVRLKAFGAIHRGVEQVIKDIKGNTFPADFKNSSLEVVLKAITEQNQVFEGAAHPFYWKPKLRIPDI